MGYVFWGISEQITLIMPCSKNIVVVLSQDEQRLMGETR
jgi:hypothetical protein